MTLQNLIDAYRGDADDHELKYFATDEDLIDYANEAQEQACVRARLLVDSTSAITSLAFTAGGSPILALDSRVISLRRVTWSGRTLALLPRLTARMDDEYPGWEAHPTQEAPSIYVTDVATQAIRIYPTPTVSGTLRLSVYRYPLDPMVEPGDEPEICLYHHRGLVQWMLFLVFSRPDADSFNADKADRARKLFIQQFGEERSARNEAWRANEMISLPDPLC